MILIYDVQLVGLLKTGLMRAKAKMKKILQSRINCGRGTGRESEIGK